MKDSEHLLQRSRVALLDPDYEFAWEKSWEKANPVNKYKSPQALEKAESKLRNYTEKKAHDNFREQIKQDPELSKKMKASLKKCLQDDYKRLSDAAFFFSVLNRTVVNRCLQETNDPKSAYATSYSGQLKTLIEARDERIKIARNSNRQNSNRMNSTPFSEEEENPDRFFVDPRITTAAYASYKDFFARLRKDQTLATTTARLEQIKDKQEKFQDICGPFLGSARLSKKSHPATNAALNASTGTSTGTSTSTNPNPNGDGILRSVMIAPSP